ESMVITFSVAVDDAEQSAGLESGSKMIQQKNRLGDLVIGFENQGGVDALRGKQGIVFFAKDGSDIGEVRFGGPVAEWIQLGSIDIDGVHRSAGRDSGRCPHSEPPGTGTDVGDAPAFSDSENVHHPVDLQPLGALGVLEYGQFSLIWIAGRPMNA